MHNLRWWIGAAAVAMVGMAAGPARGIDLPPGFIASQVSGALVQPVKIAFANDGRMFIAEKRGTVRVYVDGVQQPAFFIDLQSEVGNGGYRGLLGMALDPDFASTRTVYLAYVVDPTFGPPEEPNFVPALGRVTRYAGSLASGGNVADPASRHVVIGANAGQAACLCHKHTISCIAIGADGSLLVSAGDGAHDDLADAGGHDGSCFQPPWYSADQDLGSFRSQYLGSLSGKIIRIDPDTGAGLPSNPFWNGDAFSHQSKVWVSGLRSPFRFFVRPDPQAAGKGPGVLFIGDVGEDTFEEINVASAAGGENFGWPCREGYGPAPDYPKLNPASSGCETIMTPPNPGPLIDPLTVWHHTDPSFSQPPGFVGFSGVGGAFYTGCSFPLAYHGALLFADHVTGWINVIKLSQGEAGDHRIINAFNFALDAGNLVDIAVDPISGDVFFVTVWDGKLHRISYVGPGPGDIDDNQVVDVGDLLAVIRAWGPCPGGPAACPEDIDGSGTVNVEDLLLVIAHWG